MVSDACVLIRDYHTGPRLVAYFTSVSGKLMPDTLREWGRRSLPEYMVPSNYYQLNELPLTPNGKIDRKQLLAMPVEDDVEVEDYLSPASATEQRLCDIWQQLFELKQVSALANFFELGGHSLLLIMLQARIQESFNKRIAIGDLFNNATVRELARIVDAAPAADGNQGFTMAAVAPQKWPLSFTQRGLWLVDNMDKGTSAYNIPSAFRLKGLVDPHALIACFTDIEQRHEVLRTRYVFDNGEVFQEILPTALPPVPVIDLSQYSDSEQEQHIEKMIEEDFHHHFDLERGHTWRVRIAALNQYELVVFVNIHHICTDGWSFRLLINEVKALYSARLAQRSSPLATLDFQYKDYALWQRQQADAVEYKEHLSFWQNILRQIPALSALPRDFDYPNERSYEGQYVEVRINRSLSEKLRLLAKSENSTIFVVLLTAYKLLLANETGQSDIVVGTDVANRTSKSAESLIGFFVNQIPLRTLIETGKTVSEQIAVIREGFIEALSHQEISFDQLVNHLNINRSSRYSPVFQTKFFMETIAQSTYDVSEEDMDMEIIMMKRQSARLDLTVGLVDTLDGIVGTMVYNTALFSRSTVERLSEKLTRILEFMVDSRESSTRILFESLQNYEKNNKSK
ncbi:MAG: condensation domain-containing protein, partial [Cellvibrio sp.]|uniref:condensation domain-containing protein n=1 Tax=Cellvibrio sp. TaxID=1965322 RepID=UPI002722A023|nr:condensation domain-containing protein [Cellvibrio sp.]